MQLCIQLSLGAAVAGAPIAAVVEHEIQGVEMKRTLLNTIISVGITGLASVAATGAASKMVIS